MPNKKSKQRRSKKQVPHLDDSKEQIAFFPYSNSEAEKEANQNAQKAISGQAVGSITPIPSQHIQAKTNEGGSTGTLTNAAKTINHSSKKGQPLPSSTKKTMEQSFGQDFSEVRIHTDSQADQANRDLSARAFTFGKDIYFKSGRYKPATQQGQELIAHELTHVVQQQGQPMIQRSGEGEEQAAPAIPRFHQKSHTCGVSSVLTAMLIFDQNNGNHQLLQSGVQKTLARYEQRGDFIAQKLSGYGLDGASEVVEIKTILNQLNNQLADPSFQPSQSDYNNFAFTLYYIFFNHNPQGGAGVALLAGEINSIMSFLGFNMRIADGGYDQVRSFIEVFGNEVVTSLKKGEIAQIRAEVRQRSKADPNVFDLFQHAFIIGRQKDGQWFFHDQGYRPPFIVQGSELMDVELDVHAAATNEQYWLVPGTFQTPGDIRLLKI